MARLVRSSLQLKLVLAFVLVLLIPAVVVGSYTLLRTHALLLDQVAIEQLRLAQERAAVVERLVTDANADLLFMIQMPAMRRYARDQDDTLSSVVQLFEAFLRQGGAAYSGLCLLNSNGDELACVRSGNGLVGVVPASQLGNRAEQAYFLSALRQASIPGDQQVSVTDVGLAPGLDSAVPPHPVLRYSTLFQNETGGVAGVLVVEAPLQPLLDLLTERAQDVSTYVVDSEGTYLLHPERARQLGGAQPSALSDDQPREAATILRQAEGVIMDSQDDPGNFQIFTRMRPHNQSALQWTIVYKQPRANIFGPIWETEAVLVAITTAAIAIAFGVAQLLSRSIVRPIKALASAAERVGAGDLHTSVPQGGPDEIGALGRTLSQTVARLQTTIAVAERRRREAETLRTATQALSSTLDLDRVLGLILSELRKVVPYNSASVQRVEGDSARIIGAYGLNDKADLTQAHFSLVPGATPNADVARTRAPVILNDAPTRFPHFLEDLYRLGLTRSWLGVPLLFGDRLIGMVTLDKHEPNFYTIEHARLASAFVAQAAVAMEHARLYEEARQELADRRRVEAAHARLAAIIEATTDAVGMCDLDGRPLYLNRAGRTLLGLSADGSLDGLTLSDLYPAWAAQIVRDVGMPVALHRGSWAGETALLHRDGSEIPVSQVIISHCAPDGYPEFVSTIMRDIRERRRAEEELRQSQKMEALGRLAGGLAHDFNNLLTVILGECDMMLGDLPAAEPSRASAEQIRQAGTRAAALTRQLLAFSRRQVLQSELISLNDVINGMEQMLRRLIGEDIALTIVPAPMLPTVRADAGQMEQVVMNLVINSRDAMPEGGHLLIETAAVQLDEAAVLTRHDVHPGAYVVVTVSDTGVGMDADTRAHIFEPFFTTKPRGKGTGLGLAMVHGIVRQSGGHIWFYSEPSQGTMFKLYLPAALGTPSPASVALEALPTRPANETVLLVEDDEPVRALAHQILVRQGFTVLQAPDGLAAQALTNAYEGSIHLLLTDVIMPGGLNGVQLAARIRTARPHIRVIYMSGYPDNAQVSQSIVNDGALYLQKPFTPATLARKVHEALV